MGPTDYSATQQSSEPLQDLTETKCVDSELPDLPKPSRWTGRRLTIGLLATLVTAIFIINIVLLGISMKRYDPTTVFCKLHTGSCKDVPSLFVWIHLAINLCGVTLLACSSTAMQIASAPTRSDIDRAHPKRTLDVGILGYRNWPYIPIKRKILWTLLALSSLPLTLFYNSAVFYKQITGTDNKFTAYVVPSRPMSDPWPVPTTAPTLNSYAQDFGVRRSLPLQSLTNMTASECAAVLTHGQNQGSTVVLAAVDMIDPDGRWPLVNGFEIDVGNGTDRCNADIALGCKITNPRNVSSRAVAVISYCLAEREEPTCTVFLHPVLLGAIIACNFIKLVCMLFLFRARGSEPLTTLGDCIASFMANPEAATRDYGPVSERSVRRYLANIRRAKQRAYIERGALVTGPQTSPCGPDRWAGSVSGQRWVWMAACCLFFLLAMGGLLLATQLNNEGGADGLIDKHAKPFSLSTLALLANLPQLALAGLYFLYNGIYTSMILSREWTSFATTRQSLRVSRPRGRQRLAYRLTVPLPFAVAFTALTAVSHWLMSQALFLTLVDVLDARGQKTSTGQQGLGYSRAYWIAFLAVQIGMFAALVCLGRRRYPAGIPLVGCCSLAISAACHPPARTQDAAFSELKYGVVQSETPDETRVGLSSEEVGPMHPEPTVA